MRLLLTLAWMTFVAVAEIWDEDLKDENVVKRSGPAVLSELQQKCQDEGYYPRMKREESYELNEFYPSNVGLKKTPCSSPSVNARGFYTSHLVPCTFQFYQISKNKEEDLKLANALSTVCFDNNTSPMEKVQASEYYIVKWEDECVGDFARCYQVERDEQILLKQICVYGLVIPPGATHVTVDCTKDKLEKEKKIAEKKEKGEDEYADPYTKLQHKHEKETKREFYMFILVLVGTCLFAVCCSCCFTFRYIIQPYLMTAMMKRSRSETEFSRLNAVVE